jgi:hypothetical protein
MDAKNYVANWLLAHPAIVGILLFLLGLSIVASKVLAPRWPVPPVEAPTWKKVLHFVFVNLPEFGRNLDGKTWMGTEFSVPFVSWSPRPNVSVDKAREVLNEPSVAKSVPPAKQDTGIIDSAILLCIGVIGFVLAIFLSGCAGFRAPAYSTLTAIVDNTGAVRDKLPSACEVVENAAVDAAKTKEEAMVTTTAIHNRCTTALTSLETVPKVARAARDGIYDSAALIKDPKALIGWAQSAINQYRDLSLILQEFKLMLPKIQGVN